MVYIAYFMQIDSKKKKIYGKKMSKLKIHHTHYKIFKKQIFQYSSSTLILTQWPV